MRFSRISATNIGQNLSCENRVVSWQMSIPCRLSKIRRQSGRRSTWATASADRPEPSHDPPHHSCAALITSACVGDVMTCHPRLERRVHRNGRVIGGAVHDRLTVNVQIDQVFCPLNAFSGTRRDQDMFAGPPVLCIHSQVCFGVQN